MSNINNAFTRIARRNGASSLRSKEPLTDERMAAIAPSVFALAAHESRSARYTQIPTSQVLAGLRAEGFLPFAVGQSGSRDEGKRGHTRHLVRLRRADMGLVGDSHPEIVLINSHDGTSQYHMLFGWFRLVCANGMVVANGPETEVKVRHSGNAQQVLDDVIGGAHQLVASVDQQAEQLERFRATRLQPAEAALLADAAINVRFDERPAGITPTQVLAARREADRGDDLWSTVNRIQENLVRGGLSFRDGRKRRSTRAVTSITADTKLNQAIWSLASKMAELKAA
jgi:hypothetical protein